MQDSLIYRFSRFTIDVSNRELSVEGVHLDLNTRYFDALVLLVREQGRLVDKDRFFREVWDDVVVSDSALTQCIKEIRRQLGDDVGNPRFIQTVPRHGYRFIAEVTVERRDAANPPSEAQGYATPPSSAAQQSTEVQPSIGVPLHGGTIATAFSQAMATTLAGTLGGASAGLVGGLLYGFGVANAPAGEGLGTASVLLVLISVTVFLGTVGGFGIGAGMAAADQASGGGAGWRIVGAAVGGMLIGGSVKLLGVDAFTLLFGRAPAGITGGMEGAALGFAIGIGAYLGGGVDAPVWWRPVAAASATGAAVGVLIALAGGHLMGGSLDLLARSFADSRLQLDALGQFFGEVRFGETTRIVLAGIEGAIFVGCVAGALVAAQQTRHSGS